MTADEECRASSTKLFYNPKTVGSNGEIYCHGRLLEKIQLAHLYADSKTFVDMKLKQSPAKTLDIFDEFIAKNPNPSSDDLKTWVATNFEEPGSEFENWKPDDFVQNPAVLDKINDKSLRSFAYDLNGIWNDLGRKIKKEVHDNEELYSIIYVENPMIVPGGRFREFYYWDSYWVLRGLLLSEMTHTAKGMLENFFSIVLRFGFIPNGGRIYYSMRSQPPLLTPMVKTYVDHTKDFEFAVKAVDVLALEFDYWMSNHTVTVNGHKMALYGDRSSGPRPESYREDIETANGFTTDADKEEHYSELKAAAESGMDFSSRWFIDADGGNNGTLANLKTRSIVPVELNAILHWNAKIIAEFYGYAGNLTKQSEYLKLAKDFQDAVNDVLWDEEAGAWLDYDLINLKRRPYFVPTNLSPLWMRCYDVTKRVHIASKVMSYINNTRLDDYPGGVPTTLVHSGEQWDWPNVWAPMQHMLIVGLDNLGTKESKEKAQDWAQRWVLSNYLAYKESGHMFEKYMATELGGHGGGGEYEVQTGFGWTNGVILDLLDHYGHVLSSSVRPSAVGFLITSAMAVATKLFTSIRG
ncbi:trehalase isoform X3 [Chironomus tepperi]|uniref:trehalase isoform X3 n=1 Tax=Chironomus tepperi TaxID=113505 RepID=UPI00391FB517